MRFRGIFSLMLAAVTLQVAAAQHTRVFNPVFPVLVDRPYNIVCEIAVQGGETEGRILNEVAVQLQDIDPSAVKNVRLMYSGTMSVIPSRSKGFVLNDQVKKLGGGQTVWCDPDFVKEISKLAPSNMVWLHFMPQVSTTV